MSGKCDIDKPESQPNPIIPKTIEKQSGRGRPSMYTHELGQLICDLYASDPKITILDIFKRDDMPAWQTFYDWAEGKVESALEFPEMFARAKRVKASIIAEASLSTADGPGDDLDSMTRVRRDEFRAKTAQWLAAKLNPAEYGDSQRVSVDVNVTRSITGLSDDDLLAIIQRHQAQLSAPAAALPEPEVVDVEAERVDESK